VKGDYRTVDDSGFFFSIVDDNLRQGCATRSAINTSNDTSPNVFFYDTSMCVIPNANEAERQPLPFDRCVRVPILIMQTLM